jgi:two-component system KDP operon response regulator KdpE
MVILDRNMPGVGGLETCRAIRNTSDIGIIMLTVRKAESDRIEALDAGADDYVTKPFSMPELSARIRANLRRVPSASRSGAQTIRFGVVSVDLATHHLSVAGTDVRLTPKQFEVLQYFVENANVSIPHARLLQAVWGPDYREEVEYLHVVVNQLRKKIEADPSHPRYIITEPWFGYRFQFPGDTDQEAG